MTSQLFSRRAGWSLSFNILLAAAYVLCGKAALLLAAPPGYATPVFPPAGIALGAVFIGGFGTLPWIFLGSYVLNIWVGYTHFHQLAGIEFISALAIAIASALQAGIGGAILRKVIGYPTSLDTGRDIATMLLLIPLACLVSATLSVGSLAGLGVIAMAGAITSWGSWWIGDTLGCVVMLPLMMVVAGEPRVVWRARLTSVAIPMMLVFGIFVVIFAKTDRWEQDDSLSEFRLQAQQSVDTIRMYLDEQAFLLEQLRGFFLQDADQRLTRAEFARYVRPMLSRFPMIQAIEWAPRVASPQRNSFERSQLAGFGITERDKAGEMVRAGNRADYYPITYMEPFAGNGPAMGFDLASQADRQAALVAAINGDRLVATAPVRLVQERDRQMAILLFLPVKEPGHTPGVVLTVLRMGSFINALLAPKWPLLHMRLEDVDTRKVLFDNTPGKPDGIVFRSGFTFGTRRYQLLAMPTPGYLQAHVGWESWGVLAMGIVGTGLFGCILLLVSGYANHMEDEVTARTHALEESEAKLEEITNTLGEGVYVLNREGLIEFVNPEAERLLGWSKEELLGRHAHTKFHAGLNENEKLVAGECRIANVIATGRIYRSDDEVFYRKDGTSMPVFVTSAPITRDNIYVGAVAVFKDITDRKRTEQALRESEERFRLISTTAGEAIIMLDAQGRVTYWNPAAENIFGYSARETLDRSLHDMIIPESHCDGIRRGYEQFAASGTGAVIGKTFEITALRRSGEEFPVELSVSAFKLHDQWHALGVVRDISERRKREQEYRTIIQTARDGFLIVDAHDGHFVDVNDAYCDMVGYTRDEVLAMGINDVEAVDSPLDVERAQGALRRIGYAQFETRHRCKDGSTVSVEVTATFLDIRGGVFITFIRDITERKKSEERIRTLAYYDPLTKLPNRVLLLDRMRQVLFQARRYQRSMAVMFLDLDHFKHINDTLGHDAGDELLKEVATRLTSAIRTGDTVSRQGGDEFVIVLAELAHAQDAALVAEKILKAMKPPFDIKGNEIHISASIGIAMFDVKSGDDMQELMKKADIAMYGSKAQGRNRYQFYMDT